MIQEKLRVFVSYSHEDQKLVKHIVRTLRANGVVPIFDKNFAFGSGFHEQIKQYIAHSHIFMPVITESSTQRGWVHQEIGFAAALNVPVLPVALGALPGEMIGQLHAARLDGTKATSSKKKKCKNNPANPTKMAKRVLRRLETVLTNRELLKLVRRSRELKNATFECAPLPEDRTQKMAAYAQTVLDIQESVPGLGKTALVRQMGALSSYHIPNLPLSHQIWRQRYGIHPRSKHHCRLQREERRALTKLAAESGCRLIVNDQLDYSAYGDEARLVRLNCLLDFLQSGEVANVEVAFDENMESTHSLTIVGDWYCAEAISGRAGHGYDQTIFTRHAPSMNARIEAFDETFHDLLGGESPKDSRENAIEKLQKHIAILKAE